MKFLNKIVACNALGAALVLMLAPVAYGRTRKGDKLLKQAETALNNKQYDQAVNLLDEAVSLDATEPAYLMADQRAHAKASEWHVAEGHRLQKLSAQGNETVEQHLQAALVEFNKALLAEPSNRIAMQEIAATNQMIAEAKLSNKPVLTPLEKARQETEARISSLDTAPQLKPITDLVTTLKLNNQPARMLYDSVAKIAGLNVLLDPSGIETQPGKTYNLDLRNVTLEEALDYVALETHTFWKPISRNAIFITQENEPKRQEYQDEVMKVFYIQNAATQAEFTEIFNAVRTGTKLNQGIYQVASQNAIVARGPVDAIALVEKLIHDLDKPKPEVSVDVVVMEVNKVKKMTLGAALLGQGGFSAPITFNPRNPITIGGGTTGTGSGTGTGGTGTTGSTGSTGSTAITIAQLGHLSSADWATTLPSALLQALMSDTTSRVLQRPQLRCTDGGKASLKIGEKIPYVSGSLNSAVATPGSIPYATTQFQQVDVGVNIDLEPHVNGPEDVSMKIKVEISNENGSVSIGGIDEPIITQRVNEAQIRMRDGEVALLGGLSDKENQNDLNGFPGLTNIPVLGYLFGTKTKQHNDDEILIALIPHIVRAPDYRNAADPGVFAGTEHSVRVHHKSPITGDDGVDGHADGAGQPGNAAPQNAPVPPATAPAAPYTATPTPPRSTAPPQQ